MIPVVGTAHIATTADTQRVPYTCPACSLETVAIVSVVSQGYAEAPYFIGNDSAAAAASNRANAGLPSALRRTLGLAGCPLCRKRDPETAGLQILLSILLGIALPGFILIPAAAFGIGYAVDERTGTALGIGAACVIIALLGIGLVARSRYRRLCREADSQVVWDEAITTSAAG